MKKLAAATGALALALAAAAPEAHAGIWLQQSGRLEGDSCLDGWSSSWAEWPNGGTGGFVCSRELDDPSVPVPIASSTPAPAPGPAPGPAWVVLFRPTLQPGELVGGSIVGWCPDNSDPQDLRSVPNTDIATLYYGQLMEGYLENLGTQVRTFDLEALCG
jgi:hypothetical protein